MGQEFRKSSAGMFWNVGFAFIQVFWRQLRLKREFVTHSSQEEGAHHATPCRATRGGTGTQALPDNESTNTLILDF